MFDMKVKQLGLGFGMVTGLQINNDWYGYVGTEDIELLFLGSRKCMGFVKFVLLMCIMIIKSSLFHG